MPINSSNFFKRFVREKETSPDAPAIGSSAEAVASEQSNNTNLAKHLSITDDSHRGSNAQLVISDRDNFTTIFSILDNIIKLPEDQFKKEAKTYLKNCWDKRLKIFKKSFDEVSQRNVFKCNSFLSFMGIRSFGDALKDRSKRLAFASLLNEHNSSLEIMPFANQFKKFQDLIKLTKKRISHKPSLEDCEPFFTGLTAYFTNDISALDESKMMEALNYFPMIFSIIEEYQLGFDGKKEEEGLKELNSQWRNCLCNFYEFYLHAQLEKIIIEAKKITVDLPPAGVIPHQASVDRRKSRNIEAEKPVKEFEKPIIMHKISPPISMEEFGFLNNIINDESNHSEEPLDNYIANNNASNSTSVNGLGGYHRVQVDLDANKRNEEQAKQRLIEIQEFIFQAKWSTGLGGHWVTLYDDKGNELYNNTIPHHMKKMLDMIEKYRNQSTNPNSENDITARSTLKQIKDLAQGEHSRKIGESENYIIWDSPFFSQLFYGNRQKQITCYQLLANFDANQDFQAQANRVGLVL